MTQSEIEAQMNSAWPWASSFKRQLCKMRPDPLPGSHLIFGSDYSGDHSGSRYLVYGFIVGAGDSSHEWPAKCREVRRSFLPNGRRMSFKNMNDGHRRRALVPFLEAAEYIEGHVVGVVVTKELVRLCTGTNSMEVWQRLHGLRGRWDPKAFEQMVRVAHFFSLFVSAWSAPRMDVSWITDNDQIVANPDRLDDAQQFAARLSWLYVPHQLGEFMMNTVAIDGPNREMEDLLAIPDLTAGMLAEMVADPSTDPDAPRRRVFNDARLSPKSQIIADWFWHRAGPPRKPACSSIASARGC